MKSIKGLIFLFLTLAIIGNASAEITLENAKQLTTDGTWESAKYILDGSKIMGVKDKETWLMNMDGTSKELFNGSLLAWSPDGTKIAYSDQDAKYNQNQAIVYIKELKSGTVSYFYFADTYFKDYGIRWLGENKIILYLYDGKYLLETDTGKLFAYIPSVTRSPNGKQVLYINDGFMYLMNTSSFYETIKNNYNYPVEFKKPIETNTNLKINPYMFYNNEKTSKEWENSINQLFSKGLRLKDVSDSTTTDFEFSPDGTKIFFKKMVNCYIDPPLSCYFKIYIIDGDGSNETQIYESSNSPMMVWVFNGKKLIFQDKAEEWIIDNDGINKQKLEIDGKILDSYGNNLLLLKEGNLYEATLSSSIGPSATGVSPKANAPSQSSKKIPGLEAFYALILILIISIFKKEYF